MSKLKDLRKESIGKLNAIKSFNEKVKNFDGDFMKKLDGDAKDLLKNQGKKLQDFADKAKKKLPNTKNIFDGLISDLDKMIGIEEIKGESKIRKYTRESIDETINSTKQVVIDNVKKVLFANDSNFGCGTSSAMPYNDITIKPTEFDFLGTLKMDPATPMGSLLYEDQKQRTSDSEQSRMEREKLIGTTDYLGKGGQFEKNLGISSEDLDLKWYFDKNNDRAFFEISIPKKIFDVIDVLQGKDINLYD